ncbi:MBL fold metallo-hydrolase [Brevibacillus ginsengisoli]|uniref:MBL fold metallo-hydrolase n=1 Tax=Brevibacillus ginsengisoli TaxID=363854 RepID=UPI003CFB4786
MRQKQVIETPYFTLEEVSNAVYAAIAKPGKGAMGNAGFVDVGEGLLVFDTFTTPQAARSLRVMAEELTGKQVKYVVNSHYHGDHTFGNQVFPEATIISTELTRIWHAEKNIISNLEDEKKSMEDYLDNLKSRIQDEENDVARFSLQKQYGDIEQVYFSLDELQIFWPTLTFEKHMTIHGSSLSVELYCFGGGHTVSDAVMLLPQEKILFAGDLIFENHHAPIYDSEAFNRNLQELKTLDFHTVIPGHGKLASREQLDVILHYIEYVKRDVDTQMNEGKTLDEILETPTPQPYAAWAGVDGYKRNLRTVYQEHVK